MLKLIITSSQKANEKKKGRKLFKNSACLNGILILCTATRHAGN